MMSQVSRPRHPKKEVEAAIAYAESLGFRVRFPWGHWGALLCQGDCMIAVFSTPRNAGNHARQIRRAVDGCPHRTEQGIGNTRGEGE